MLSSGSVDDTSRSGLSLPKSGTVLVMRTTRTSLFFALTLPAATLGFVVACGGSGGANAGDTSTPASAGGSTASASAGGSSGGASGASAANAAGGGTTTTTALPDGGELQGAKLGSTTHTEVETKGESGPKAGPGHQQEPGRRREDIQTIIQSHRDEARACYDKGLKDHPGIEGDLDVKWTIDPQGNVADAAVDSSKSTIHEPSVGSCIVDVIKKIKFAPSKGGFETRAHYPFNFHPRQFSGKDAGK